MYAFLWANIWDFIFYAGVCYVVSVMCEFVTNRRFFFGTYFVKDREPFKAILIFLFVVVLLPPLSWILALCAVVVSFWKGRHTQLGG